jgi:hypothetical protein
MYAEQTNGIDKTVFNRWAAAGAYQRCAWPGDFKGVHQTMDCYPWKRVDNGTARFPKANDYQTVQNGTYTQVKEESEVDLHPPDGSDGSEWDDDDWDWEE